MGNSAFNQGQTGNATEVASGVVQEATVAQVSDKTDIGDTGAKLFVPPSKLPSSGEISLPAYEDILKGDAIGISHYYPAQENNIYDNTANGDSDQANTVTDFGLSRSMASTPGAGLNLGNSNVFIAQKFFAPSNFDSVTGQLLQINSLTIYYDRNTFTPGVTVRLREDSAGTPAGAVLASVVKSNEGTKVATTLTISGVDLVPGNVYWIEIERPSTTSAGTWVYRCVGIGNQWIEDSSPTAVAASDANVLIQSTSGSAWTTFTDLGAGTGLLEVAASFYAMPSTGGISIQKFQIPSGRDNVLWARPEEVRAQITQDTANIMQAFILDVATPVYGSLLGLGAKSATVGLTTITACSSAEAEKLSLDTDLWMYVIQDVAGVASVRKDSTDTDPITSNDIAYTSINAGVTLTELTNQNFIMQLDITANQALGHYKIFKASAAAFDNRLAFAGYAKEDCLTGADCLITQAKSTSIHTGLTVGRKYYLQDIDGAIGLAAGTRNIELGYAISATELYRDRNASVILQSVGAPFYPQNDGLIFTNDSGGAILNLRIYDRVNLGAGEVLYLRNELADGEGSLGGYFVTRGEQVAFEGGWDRRGFQLIYPS